MTAQNTETLFLKYQWLIDRAIHINTPLLRALRLDNEDVAQDLSIALIKAIGKFDPSRSKSMQAYLTAKLQYEILNIKRRYKPNGITGAKGKVLEFLYMDKPLPNGFMYELPICDDTTSIEADEFIESLKESESEAIALKSKGFPIRRKAQSEALANVRGKYFDMYESERRIAA